MNRTLFADTKEEAIHPPRSHWNVNQKVRLTERPARVYTLYQNVQGITCQSEHYDGVFYHVGATSIKQAYYLLAHNEWGYPIGILEKYVRGGQPSTVRYDGSYGYGTRFNHGQRIRLRVVIRNHGSVRYVG